MEEELKQEDFINIRQMNAVKPSEGPKIDKLVSQAVGKTIYTTNSILIKKLAEWKRGDDNDPANPQMDNFLDDPKKVEELRKIL